MLETGIRNVLTMKMVVTDPESLQTYVFLRVVRSLQWFSHLCADSSGSHICAQIYTRTSMYINHAH
jgi:hypothetical protein